MNTMFLFVFYSICHQHSVFISFRNRGLEKSAIYLYTLALFDDCSNDTFIHFVNLAAFERLQIGSCGQQGGVPHPFLDIRFRHIVMIDGCRPSMPCHIGGKVDVARQHLRKQFQSVIIF